MQNNLVMTSSPHLRDHSSTQRIMQEVCLALLPAGIAGVIIFGWSALMLICVSVATCVLSEFVWEKLTKRTVTIGDWSAVVTGLLLAYNLPANAPWWLAVVGGVIAIILVKQMFGGIGSNFMNPALTARAILFVSWSALMSSYPQSNFVVDATTSATPLGLLSKGVSGVKVYGRSDACDRGSIVALNIADVDSAEVADRLASDYDICVRAGAHCAPLMHKALGTQSQGAVRFSFAAANTAADADAAAKAVREIAHAVGQGC